MHRNCRRRRCVLAAIEAIGAVPFIPFKSNSVGMSSKSEPWKRMWCHFKLRSEEFRAHYHRRSNVESTMWMIKSKFGGSVRSRLPMAQTNEVLAKVLCHNLTCIVHAVAEFGIDVDLSRPPLMPNGPTTATESANTAPSTTLTLTLLPASPNDEQGSR